MPKIDLIVTVLLKHLNLFANKSLFWTKLLNLNENLLLYHYSYVIRTPVVAAFKDSSAILITTAKHP